MGTEQGARLRGSLGIGQDPGDTAHQASILLAHAYLDTNEASTLHPTSMACYRRFSRCCHGESAISGYATGNLAGPQSDHHCLHFP
jgi:hypothetical protein